MQVLFRMANAKEHMTAQAFRALPAARPAGIPECSLGTIVDELGISQADIKKMSGNGMNLARRAGLCRSCSRTSPARTPCAARPGMSLQMIGVSCRWPGCFASLSSTCFCRRIGAMLPIGAKLLDKTPSCSEAVHVSRGGLTHVLDIKKHNME